MPDKDDPIHEQFLIRAEWLASALPGLFDEELASDSYCTVNGLWRPGCRWAERTVDVPQIIEGQRVIVPQSQWYREEQMPLMPEGVYYPGEWLRRGGYRSARNRQNMAYLNAAFADLDGYRVGLDVPALLAGVARAQDENLIPPASALMRSGRGLWVMWLLADQQTPNIPQRAFADKLGMYARVMKELNHRLAHLGADANATDAARYCRVPGSINGSAPIDGDRRVRFWVQGTADGVPRYRLSDLTQLLGVPERRRHPAIRAAAEFVTVRVVDEKRQQWGKAGQHARIRFALAGLNLIEELRGGFHQGTRSRAAFYLALFLAKSKVSEAEVVAEVRALGQRCRPALPASECEKAARQGLKIARNRQVRTGAGARGSWASYDTIIDQLAITDSELMHLRAVFGEGRGIRRMPGPKERSSKMNEKAARQAVVRELVTSLGHVPSYTKMAALLETRGYPVTRGTIFNDYSQLGYRELRAGYKGGRPASAALFRDVA